MGKWTGKLLGNVGATMDTELEKAYCEYLDSLIVFKINIEDIINEICKGAIIYFHAMDYNFLFDIDGFIDLKDSQIKEIEQRTGATFIGKYCDWCFEYKEET